MLRCGPAGGRAPLLQALATGLGKGLASCMQPWHACNRGMQPWHACAAAGVLPPRLNAPIVLTACYQGSALPLAAGPLSPFHTHVLRHSALSRCFVGFGCMADGSRPRHACLHCQGHCPPPHLISDRSRSNQVRGGHRRYAPSPPAALLPPTAAFAHCLCRGRPPQRALRTPDRSASHPPSVLRGK